MDNALSSDHSSLFTALFGHLVRREEGGSTVFTAEWDYTARMQPVPLFSGTCPGGTFLYQSRTMPCQVSGPPPCSSVSSYSVTFELCKTTVLHLQWIYSSRVRSVVTFHATKSGLNGGSG